VGFGRYFLTTCTAHRRPLFSTASLAASVVTQLLHDAARFEFAVSAYCLMPDHLHALLEAESERSDFRSLVKRFKPMTGFAHCRDAGQPLWQPGYHERILRNDEASEAVVRYILENPIRARLTKEIGEYPFAGSGVYDSASLKTAWEGRHEKERQT
jgi:putative transposase